MRSFGAPLSGISAEDLANPETFIGFGREPQAVDIMPSISGVEFDAAWERRVEGVVDSARGLIAPFISKADLIAAKLATGRLRDLADVEAILDTERSQ